MVGAAVSELVNQPGVAMKVENDRLIDGEQAVKVPVGQAVEVFGLRLQLEQVDDVDETDFDFGKVLPEQGGRRQGLHGRDVARAGHHHVGFIPLVVAGPIPDPNALGAVPDGVIPGQVLEMKLLIRNDDVDIVRTA